MQNQIKFHLIICNIAHNPDKRKKERKKIAGEFLY